MNVIKSAQAALSSLPSNRCLLLACSGGPDSVALFWVLRKLKVDFAVAHFNHGLRGRASDLDEQFVSKLCASEDIPFHSTKRNLSGGEQQYRQARYRYLRSLDYDFILTAHTRDDQLETIFHNFLRGTGLRGLTGMRPLDGDLVRPLLEVTKTELLDFLGSRPYRRDRSNHDTTYARNFLRLKVFPLLNKRFSFSKALLRQADIMRELDDHLTTTARRFLRSNWKKRSLPRAKFEQLPKALQQVVLRELYQKIYGHQRNFSHTQVEQLLRLLELNKSNVKKEFGRQYFLKLQRTKIILEPK